MKTLVVLLFSLVLFSCTDSDTDENTDSTDVLADDADTTGDDAEDPEFTDGDTDVGTDSADEADVGPDVKNPLTEYLFIEGKWKRVECNGNPCMEEKIRDITIESWDYTLGAKLVGFAPFDSIHLKKNPNNGQFEFGNPEGWGLVNGTANPISLTIETNSYPPYSPQEVDNFIWKKIE